MGVGAIGARDAEEEAPERGDAARGAQLGIDQPRPGGCGDSGDAPDTAIGHALRRGLGEGLATREFHRRHTRGVGTGERLGVGRVETQIGRAGAQKLRQLAALPDGASAERGGVAMQHPLAQRRRILPEDDDIASAQRVGALGELVGDVDALAFRRRIGHHQRLPRPQVDADAQQHVDILRDQRRARMATLCHRTNPLAPPPHISSTIPQDDSSPGGACPDRVTPGAR